MLEGAGRISVCLSPRTVAMAEDQKLLCSAASSEMEIKVGSVTDCSFVTFKKQIMVEVSTHYSNI